MREQVRRIVTAGCLLAMVAGCRDSDEDGKQRTASSASGQKSGSKAISTFVVASDPDVSIGVVEGESAYTMSGVSDATRLSNGGIVVASCQAGELLYFDSAGHFLKAVGGKGEGPGEFTYLRLIFPMHGDTVAAYDAAPRKMRITTFGPDGTRGRMIRLDRYTIDWPRVNGWMASGHFVATRLEIERLQFSARATGRARLLRFDAATGQAVDSVDLPALEPPGLNLGRMLVVAVMPNRILYGAQDDSGIAQLNTALNHVGVTKTITRSQPVTEQVKSVFEAMLDDGAHIPRGGVGPIRSPEYASVMPAFKDIVAGRDGRLWVQDPIRPNHYPLVWTAYEDDHAVMRVELPTRFFPFEFGTDWVLGVSYDDFGIERVELRRFVPGELTNRVLPPRDAAPVNMPRCGSWVSR